MRFVVHAPRRRWIVSALLVWQLAGCRETDRAESYCSGEEPPPNLQTTFGGERSVEILVPDSYDPTCPTPLLLILHGYGVNGFAQMLYFDAFSLVRRERVIVAAPDGTPTATGERYWNFGAACCSFFDPSVNDVAYLSGLIDEISQVYAIDPEAIYVLGHSNGAFMAYRLACALGRRIRAIVSLAGASDVSLDDCLADPVSVLQIHGTADEVVLYQGGDNLLDDGGPQYPGAVTSTALWASHDGCGSSRSTDGAIDLDLSLPGDETQRQSYGGCPVGERVSLWRIEGGSHIPTTIGVAIWFIWEWLAGLEESA